MGIVDWGKADAKSILEDIWDVTITFSDTTEVKGAATKHSLTIDPDTGVPVNSKNTHITVAESTLTDAGITVRNADQEVDLKGVKVSFEDSTGVLKHYLIDETMPDEAIGIIVCILGDWE